MWKTLVGKSTTDGGVVQAGDVMNDISQVMKNCTSFPNLGIIFAEASKFHEQVGTQIASNTSPDTVLIGGCVR